MRSYYIPDSVLPQRYHFSRQDIEKAARDELRQVECLPKSAEPIDLEKYLFRRHDKLEPQSTDSLATGVLGAADLMNPRKPAIWISEAVFDGAPARYRSTLAHEIGHLVLHASLYIDEEFPHIVARCRGGTDLARGFQCGIDQIKEQPQAPLKSAHPLFHLEYQANLFMVAMLTPTPLVRACVEPWTCISTRRDGSRISSLDESARPEAVALLAEKLQVSRELAKYRLEELFPPSSAQTLSQKPNDRPAQSASGSFGVVSGKNQKTLW